MQTLFGQNNDKSNTHYTFKIGNTQTNNLSDIVNGFSNYFATIGSNLAKKIPDTPTSYKNYMNNYPAKAGNSMYLTPTDPQEIKKTIMSSKSKKSVGRHFRNFRRYLRTLFHPFCFRKLSNLEEIWV